MKDELEELAFAELNSEARDSITQRLKFLREQGGDMVGRIIDELKRTLAESGLQALIVGREKSPYRSEEHTSELQSLMRNSYAVFCLKKKKTQNTRHLTQ